MITVTSAISEKPVWFITGCSTDFGRELGKRALERGCRTVVTTRKPTATLEELRKEFRAADSPKVMQGVPA
jgi:NAD(P)-dependent dehydrogenase (short-subunit alcohol dehydrogenase family)